VSLYLKVLAKKLQQWLLTAKGINPADKVGIIAERPTQ